MRSAPSNVALIRAPRPQPVDPLPFLQRDRTNALIDRWRAPMLDESVIEAHAARYLMTPRVGMSFVEYLVCHGVGELKGA